MSNDFTAAFEAILRLIQQGQVSPAEWERAFAKASERQLIRAIDLATQYTESYNTAFLLFRLCAPPAALAKHLGGTANTQAKTAVFPNTTAAAMFYARFPDYGIMAQGAGDA